MEPDFMILDEPVSNLDVSIQAQIVNLLMELKGRFELTYLFISHDLNLVTYMSDTIGVMYGGQLVETGPVEMVMKTPLHGYTRDLLSSSARVHGSRITGHASAADRTAGVRQTAGCAYRERCEFEGEHCGVKLPDLIDTGGGHCVACRHAAASVESR